MAVIFDMWGKTSDDDGIIIHRPLIYHMMDSACVAEAIWDKVLSPQVKVHLSEYLRVDDTSARSWFGFWVGLHDRGKASPAFQSKSPEMMELLKSKGYRFARGDHPHGIMTAHFVNMMFKQGTSHPLQDDLRRSVCFALGGHHGRSRTLKTLNRIGERDTGLKEWDVVRQGLFDELASSCGLRGVSTPSPDGGIDKTLLHRSSPVLRRFQTGFASSEDFFNPEDRTSDLDGYWETATARAEGTLDHLRWNTSPCSEQRKFQEIFPFISDPNPMQRAAIELGDRLDKPGLVVIEAPMGEGKTETALYLAERWEHNLGHDSFYIALPTQATADQMFSRTENYLKRSGKRINLVLLHGHAVLSEEYQQLKVIENELDEPGSSVAANEWFTHRKRGVLSPYGVGTIDQALLSVLPTKHFFVRLFGLAGKIVIIDEVHSYDLYMSTLLDRLLEWLRALGSSVIMLSATLPRDRRDAMLSKYSGRPCLENRLQYPRMTWVIGDTVGGTSFPSASRTYGKVTRIEWMSDDRNEMADTLADALKAGGTAAFICNTVNKAQDIYLGLKARFQDTNVEVDLFHARYPYGQRKERQDRTLDHFGKKERTPGIGRILVATQVIEQSLRPRLRHYMIKDRPRGPRTAAHGSTSSSRPSFASIEPLTAPINHHRAR